MAPLVLLWGTSGLANAHGTACRAAGPLPGEAEVTSHRLSCPGPRDTACLSSLDVLLFSAWQWGPCSPGRTDAVLVNATENYSTESKIHKNEMPNVCTYLVARSSGRHVNSSRASRLTRMGGHGPWTWVGRRDPQAPTVPEPAAQGLQCSPVPRRSGCCRPGDSTHNHRPRESAPCPLSRVPSKKPTRTKPQRPALPRDTLWAKRPGWLRPPAACMRGAEGRGPGTLGCGGAQSRPPIVRDEHCVPVDIRSHAHRRLGHRRHDAS